MSAPRRKQSCGSRFWRLLGSAATMLCLSSLAPAAEGPPPFPGTRSAWHGFDRYEFEVAGKLASVVVPPDPAPGKPWVWHGEFFGHKPAPDIALLERGFHIVYLRVPDLLGAPEAVAHWNRLYTELTGRYGFARRVALVGLSRGGLYCYNWAAANPDKVSCIYGDAPVCDFKSWPGGKGKGRGSPRDWALVLAKYGFADEAAALAYDKNPVDNLAPLAAAKVPLLHVYGDADDVVPWQENTGLIAERYQKLGGSIRLIGKPGVGHHPHGLEDSAPIVEFIARHTEVAPRSANAFGRYAQVSYPPSTEAGELVFGATYTVWIPATARRLRGVIVHQHGCGAGACRGGETAAFDLHWQALAAKWDCALLGPSYHQEDKQNCRLWCDPRNGSRATFLRALDDLALQTGRPELAAVPWCLWGHSGGAFWASLMQTLDPERIVAIWLRSGTAYAAWQKEEIAKPALGPAVYAIPVICNPGGKERGDARFDGAWTGGLAMFQAYRSQGAPIGFAPDPRTAHECGDSRYLAIPFFDACLAQRLPEATAAEGPPKLRPIAVDSGWLAAGVAEEPAPAEKFMGPKATAVWLPDERVARAWSEYVKTGAVGDTTPPPAPANVRVRKLPQGGLEITWSAQADFESGLQACVIERGGQALGQVPEKPLGRFGRPLYQAMSYHDTPERGWPEFRFVIAEPAADAAEYQVRSVNGVGLRSEPAAVK